MSFDASTAALLVRLNGQRYGLPLTAVERVLPMASVVAVPGSGDGLLGMLNLHGNILPVADPHGRLGLPRPDVTVEHRLILLRGDKPFLLWVDEVDEVVALPPDAFSGVPTQQVTPVVPTVVRLGEAIVPLLAPAALEPRGSAA
jgi:chemotaxis signal transduction protein